MTDHSDRWADLGTADPDGPQWAVGRNWKKHPNPCRCTDEELLATARMDPINFFTRDYGIYRPEILNSIFMHVTPENQDPPYTVPKMSDIAMVRLVCAKVLKYRSNGNRHAETAVLQSATGAPLRWRRRPQHMDAVTYLMAAVCPHVTWDGARRPRKTRKAREREIEQSLAQRARVRGRATTIRQQRNNSVP